MHTTSLCLLSVFTVGTCLAGQNAPAPKPSPTGRTIEMANATRVTGIPYTGAFAYPFTCSSSGQVYAGEYAFDMQGRMLSAVPDLYRVSPLGNVQQIRMPLPSGYSSVDSPSFFAGENSLVALIGVSQPRDSDKDAKLSRTSFLSVTDSNGDHPELIRLDLEFDPVQVAVFGSGEFLVLGTQPTTFLPSVALLNANGNLIRYIDLLSSKMDTGGQKETSSASVQTGSIARFAPWGSDILLVLPGIDRSAVYHFRPSGQFERLPIQLPSDEEVEGVLGTSGKENWVIRTRSAESMKKALKSHIVENPSESLYEVSSHNGKVLNRLQVLGPNPSEIACAADGKLTAMWVDWPKDAKAPDGILLASAPR